MDRELARHALSLFGGDPLPERRLTTYRPPVYQTLHAVVVRPFRCQVGGIVRRVEPGELVELIEPHYHSEIALGRVRPAV